LHIPRYYFLLVDVDDSVVSLIEPDSDSLSESLELEPELDLEPELELELELEPELELELESSPSSFDAIALEPCAVSASTFLEISAEVWSNIFSPDSDFAALAASLS
jgi:hypothetical protein